MKSKKEEKKLKKQEKKLLKQEKDKLLKESVKEKYAQTPTWVLAIYNFITNKIVFGAFSLTLFILLQEILLKIVCNTGVFNFSTIRILLSSFIISLFINGIISLFRRRIQRIINSVIMGIITIYFLVEHILYKMIGFFMGIGNADQGTKVGEYVKDVLRSLTLEKVSFLLLGIALIVAYIFLDKFIAKRRRSFNFNKGQKIYIFVVSLVILVGLNFLYYYTVKSDKFKSELQADSNIALLLYPENSNLVVNNFGVIVYFLSDIVNQYTGIDSNYILKMEARHNTTKKDKEDEFVPVDYKRTIDDRAWDTLIANTSNDTFNTLNNYFKNRDITQKNDMTGIFKGKNLIIILMESVNEISIMNEEDFPTMYKMYNEGISFRNNYSPRNNCSTGNNEMTVLTSLWSINNTCTTNAYSYNKYPEASFNIFNKAGYTTAGFHDYTQKFYMRSRILPNMGAMNYYGAVDLGVNYSTSYTEADDAEMYKLAKPYYMDKTPFMVYFATVTPHQSYIDPQTCSDRYYEKYKNKGYSNRLARYLSKLQVFDEALAELLKELKDEGELDNTVIALFGDHYPYGLNQNEINEYLNANNAGYKVTLGSTTNANIDRTPLIIYNAATKPIQVKSYSTIIDLLPTLLNMFDVEYDPRLYLGTDIFSESHVSRAYFSDKSWVDEVGMYYAPTNKMTYYGEQRYDSAVIAGINKEISTRQSMSATAITSNYFKYLGEGLEKYKVKEEVTTTKNQNSDE